MILIFYVSIVKINSNEYKVLASQGEELLGGEDFNQRLFDYVIKEIKKDQRFKNINLEKKDLLKIKKAVDNLKNDLSELKEAQFFVDLNYDDFKLKITTKEYKKLCGEKWKEIFNKLNQTFENNNIPKTDIQQIILVGG